MHASCPPAEADIILGAFANRTDTPDGRAPQCCEVIDFAPFLANRRHPDAARVAPTSDPA